MPEVIRVESRPAYPTCTHAPVSAFITVSLNCGRIRSATRTTGHRAGTSACVSWLTACGRCRRSRAGAADRDVTEFVGEFATSGELHRSSTPCEKITALREDDRTFQSRRTFTEMRGKLDAAAGRDQRIVELSSNNSSRPRPMPQSACVRRLQIREHRKWRTLVVSNGVDHNGGRSDQVVHVVDTAKLTGIDGRVVRRSGQCPRSPGSATTAEKKRPERRGACAS